MSGEIEVPDSYDEYDYDVKALTLATGNNQHEIRAEIDSIVGLDSTEWENDRASHLTKEQMAHILLALGWEP